MATLSDDFNRTDSASLGASWTEAVDGTDIYSNTAMFVGQDAINVHTTSCSDVNQYGKLSWTGASSTNSDQLRLYFRYTNSSSAFYSINFNLNGDTVSWLRHTGTSDLAGTSITSSAATIDDADTWGVTIDGTSTNTVVRCWKSPTGSAPNSATDWGGDTTPDVTFTTDPASPVDTGNLIGFGIRSTNSYTVAADNWSGGDTPAAGAPRQMMHLSRQRRT